MHARPHLVIVTNVDWFFLSHRLSFARRAVEEGWSCTVVAADTGRGEEIRDAGLGFETVPFTRSGTNPLAEARVVPLLRSAYGRLKPTLVHQMTIKPVLYGSVASRSMGLPTLNHMTGLGHMFTSKGPLSLSRLSVEGMYRYALGRRRSLTMFENPDDCRLFEERGLVAPERTRVVRGCGVDLDSFAEAPLPVGPPVFMLPARLLIEKGVGEFVEAARRLRAEGTLSRFVLVGDADSGNPTSLRDETIRSWVDEGTVEWWGRSADMATTLAQSTVVVLPSYREGLPKVLLEAAAVGRPILTTDVPGCREVVRDGVNGRLIPPRAAQPLADAMREMAAAPELLARWGRASRVIAESEFSEQIVENQTLSLYRELLDQ